MVAWGEDGMGKEFPKGIRTFWEVMDLFTLFILVMGSKGIHMSKLVKLCSINICSLLCQLKPLKGHYDGISPALRMGKMPVEPLPQVWQVSKRKL